MEKIPQQRVQSKIRQDVNVCRVALQISSNPMNQTDLTDLIIFMTVPPTMKGQTMRTLPAGGNWNDAQRNVSFGIGKYSMKQYSKLEKSLFLLNA